MVRLERCAKGMKEGIDEVLALLVEGEGGNGEGRLLDGREHEVPARF